jgi:hypothetical protein
MCLPITAVIFLGQILANCGFLCTEVIVALPTFLRRCFNGVRLCYGMATALIAKSLKFTAAKLRKFFAVVAGKSVGALKFCLRSARRVAAAVTFTAVRAIKNGPWALPWRKKRAAAADAIGVDDPAKKAQSAAPRMSVKLALLSVVKLVCATARFAKNCAIACVKAPIALVKAIFSPVKLVRGIAAFAKSAIVHGVRFVKYGMLIFRFEFKGLFLKVYSAARRIFRRKCRTGDLPSEARPKSAIARFFGKIKSMAVAVLNFPVIVLRRIYLSVRFALVSLKMAALSMFRRIRSAVLAVILAAKWFAVAAVNCAVRIAMSPIILARKVAKKMRSVISAIPAAIDGAMVAAKKRVIDGGTRVFAVVRSPAIALPFAVVAVALLGMRAYDRQMLHLEYDRASLATHRAKKALYQKTRAARIPAYDDYAPRHRKSSGRLAVEEPVKSKKNAQSNSELQKAVDEFFCNHKVSEVMCKKGFCKIKIDDKVIDEHSVLGDNDEIYIFETDGDNIVFADTSGNKCVKSIDSLFN